MLSQVPLQIRHFSCSTCICALQSASLITILNKNIPRPSHQNCLLLKAIPHQCSKTALLQRFLSSEELIHHTCIKNLSKRHKATENNATNTNLWRGSADNTQFPIEFVSGTNSDQKPQEHMVDVAFWTNFFISSQSWLKNQVPAYLSV